MQHNQTLLSASYAELIPLSFAQQRLWFLQQLEGPSSTYNVPLALRLEGTLEIPALRAACTDLPERHESLRTVFTDSNGSPCQSILPVDDTELSFQLLSASQDTLPAELKRL